MHAIFECQNTMVNRFSNFAVNTNLYDLVLTRTVNNSLKFIVTTIGLLL